MGSALGEGLLGVVVVGIGMGDGDGAELAGLFHEFCRAGQLGSHVSDADQAVAGIVQLLETLKIRRLQVVGVLRATLLVGEVGTLHVDAPCPGVAKGHLVVQLFDGHKGLFQGVVVQGHGGGSEGSDTVGGEVTGHVLQTGQITVGSIAHDAAVDVAINNTGDHGGALQIDGFAFKITGQDGAELAVHHLKGTGTELKIRAENSGVFVEHKRLPPCVSNRSVILSEHSEPKDPSVFS